MNNNTYSDTKKNILKKKQSQKGTGLIPNCIEHMYNCGVAVDLLAVLAAKIHRC